MSDLIEREDAINEMAEYIGCDFPSREDAVECARSVMGQIPSTRPKGEWIPNPQIGWGETWVCSICGEKTTSSVMGYPRYNYCPMCGASMVEREGE